MKYQYIFSVKNEKVKMSAAVLIDALRSAHRVYLG